ncbi:MAG: isochorismatase family protein [Alphaproteobacteria bacterium]|nr:isochorismatase family protein [Alphaproteobacteria bacterium]
MGKNEARARRAADDRLGADAIASGTGGVAVRNENLSAPRGKRYPDGNPRERNMSDFQMPQHVIDRVMEKRGRLNVFDSFDPTKTAFLVIDMQNFFVDGVQPCLDIMPNINRLAGVVRDGGGLVVWVVLTVAETEDGPSLWPIYHDNFFTEEKMKAHKNGLTRGTEGHAIHKDLDVRDEDLISEKTRFSALVHDATLNIAHLCCDSWAAVAPERVAVIHRDTAAGRQLWRYADLKRASDALACALAAQGVGRGDRAGQPILTFQIRATGTPGKLPTLLPSRNLQRIKPGGRFAGR